MNNKQKINLSSKIIDDFSEKINENEQVKYRKLVENYEILVNENINNLKRMLCNKESQPIIFYNLGLVLELFLKMVLLKYQVLSPKEVGGCKHNIPKMIEIVIDKCSSLQIKNRCLEIKGHCSQIKTSNGRKIDFSEYFNFRYNHRRNSLDLIFVGIIKEKDIKCIKEILKCME